MEEVPNRAHDSRRKAVNFFHAYEAGVEPTYTHTADIHMTQRGSSLHKGDLKRNIDPKASNYGWATMGNNESAVPDTHNYKKPF